MTMPSFDMSGLGSDDAMEDLLTQYLAGAALSSAMPSFSGSGITSFSGFTGSGSSYSVGNSSESTVMKVASVETAKITLDVGELDILSVQEGQDVNLVLDADGQTYEGQVSRISNIASDDGRFKVDVTLPMAENMRFGMSVNATIVVSQKEDAILIPMDALQQTGDTVFVYKSYDENGNLTDEVTVETGLSDGVNVEIVSGLSEGDKVYYMTSGNSILDAYMDMG